MTSTRQVNGNFEVGVRFVFVSGSKGGGALKSTLDLADRLANRDHDVTVLHRVESTDRFKYLYRRTINLAVHVGKVVPAGGRALEWLGARPGRQPTLSGSQNRGASRWASVLVQNALPEVLARQRPDIVVVNGVDPVAWQRVMGFCRGFEIPVALYIREEATLYYATVKKYWPDVLLANSHGLASEAQRHGIAATMIPSVVTLENSMTATSRERVLFVNPVVGNGLETAYGIAMHCTDLQFVFQESWLLPPDERAALLRRVASLTNVEFRDRVEDVRQVYRDANILLVPTLTNTRPRVVLEAQANGIPVIASDFASLQETVGAGGLLVAADAPVADWVSALRASLASNRYDQLCQAASLNAMRPDVNPETIVTNFERAMSVAVESHV